MIHTTGDAARGAKPSVQPSTPDGVELLPWSSRRFARPTRKVLTFTIAPSRSTATQLAEIAMAAAADRARIVGDEPLIAFLSFSTRGSSAGPSVDAVREAVAEVRARAPHLAVDGDLQGDAALASVVAARKAPDSRVAGRANVLVFPTLDAGNIAYKLVQRLAGASAIGPIVQGLKRDPVAICRGGAVVDDIINVAYHHGAPGREVPVATNESARKRTS